MSGVPECIYCGSREVNHWKSWNQVGEWVCDECWPDDPRDAAFDDDWDARSPASALTDGTSR